MTIYVREVERSRLADDTRTLAELAQVIWREYYTDMIGADQVEYMLANFQTAQAMSADITEKGFRYWLGFDGEVPIGYCGATAEDSRIFLSKLYVLSSYRGRGVSKLFMNELLTWKQDAGVPTIQLTVHKGNEQSIAVYERLGFTIVDDWVKDIGEGFVMDDYLMSRT
ncbi:MAG: GNAT family N-acetyltransferase [Propionibacteriaceae bacterium]|nr:GNAT family N-acetyltransferase [Propionibacteriaceae bacterium]